MTARVLVVDDEPDVEPLFRQQFRREMREGLRRLDFALSGETTLHMIDGRAGEEIILLVLDINMPGMSGLGAHRRAQREHDEASKVRRSLAEEKRCGRGPARQMTRLRGHEVEVHYRWHAFYSRRVRAQYSEQRAGGRVVHVEIEPVL